MMKGGLNTIKDFGVSALLAVSLTFCPAARAAAGPDAAPRPVQTSVPSQPWAVQFDLTSKITKRTYRIYVHRPEAPPPPGGYPVIVFADGNISFPIATIAGLFAEVEGRGAALIVGVGYPSDDLKTLTVMRNRDLTPSQPPGAIQQYPGYPAMTAADFGGSELFYHFLVDELRPQLSARYSTDPNNQALAGHSLGGMFTLGVFFHHPEAFRSYVAMSPSVWWNNRALIADEPAISELIAAKKAAPRLLITAGSQEDDIPAKLPPGVDRAAISDNIRVNGILVNARALAERLSAIHGAPEYGVRLQIIEGEHHNTSMPDAITRAVAFALEPATSAPQ